MRVRQRGFTLIELMIVGILVGVLAAIALPAYQSQVRKGNRSAAQQFMQDVAIKEQQVLLDIRTHVAVSWNNFANTPTAGSPGLNLTVPSSTSGKYTFAVATTGNDCTNAAFLAGVPAFAVRATATGAQLTDGDLCIDSLGNKTPVAKW
jgi:type IV pilus assembly protein PilE